MLDRGEIDACTAIRPSNRVTAGDTNVIDRWGGTLIAGNPRLRKLLEDNGKAVVFEYTEDRALPAEPPCDRPKPHPPRASWVALELFEAFQRSKQIAYERAQRSAPAYLYFPGRDREEQVAVFGDDP